MPEEKDLLLKYLCMALPYKVIIKSVGENKIIGWWDLRDIDNLPLPYLRSMSSMTEKEAYEFLSFADTLFRYGKDNYFCCLSLDAILWLLEHHFDFMGLIPKGLAIEVTEENNPYEN